MAGPSHQGDGYILHLRRYREQSFLVEALTREHGRLSFVARLPSKSRRTNRDPLQSFKPFLFVWQGRGELLNLTHWEAQASLPQLQGDAILSGLYVNELIVRLAVRGDGDGRLFDSYSTTIELIAHGESLEPVLRAFEVNLLDISGYALELETTVDTQEAVEPDLVYCYALDQGPLAASPEAMGVEVKGNTLLALAGRSALVGEVLPDAKRFMRTLIHHHLGGRPLHARTLFASSADPA